MQRLPVRLDGRESFVRLGLLDATLSPVPLPQNTSCTTLELPPGAYIAQFWTSAWTHEESFVVLPTQIGSQTIFPEDLPDGLVDSAAPLRRTTAFLPADADLAMHLSRRSPEVGAAKPGEGSLFLMLRKRRPSRGGAGFLVSEFRNSPWDSIALLTADGRNAVNLDKSGSTDWRLGVACAHLNLPQGAYMLRLPAAKSRAPVSQFVFVVSGRQTQIFLLDHEPEGGEASWATARLSVHYGNAVTGFNPDSSDFLAAEEFINLIGTGMHPQVPAALKVALERTNCLTLKLAFWLSQAVPWADGSAFDVRAATELKDRLSGVSDAQLLWQTARLADRSVNDHPGVYPAVGTLQDPPMLTRAWDLALFAEARGAAGVPPGSRAARLATRAFIVGPWLRFESTEQNAMAARRSTAPTWPGTDLGFSGPEFEEFVHVLREFVGREITARMQLCSTHFNASERLLLLLICPSADPTWVRIQEKSGKALSDEIPSEELLVQTLRLPRATIGEIADAAISKLVQHTVLPTMAQLDVFVTEESDRDPILREPLQELGQIPSQLFHIGEQKPLSLLAMLFLRYRGSRAIGSKEPTLERIAAMLNRLGFTQRTRERKIVPKDVLSAIREAETFLSNFSFTALRSFEGGVWEDFQVALTPLRRYKPGTLCTVRRYGSGQTLPTDLQKQWHGDAVSYSLSLKVAANALSYPNQMPPSLNRLEAEDGDWVSRESYLREVSSEDETTFDRTLEMLE